MPSRQKTRARPLLACASVAGSIAITCSCGTPALQPDLNAPPFESVPKEQMARRGGLRFVTDYALGRRLAVENQTLQMVYFTSRGCSICREMDASVFYDPRVVALADQLIDTLMDGDAQPQWRRTFGVIGYPTFLFLDEHGHVVARRAGRQSADQLVEIMQSALGEHADAMHGTLLER